MFWNFVIFSEGPVKAPFIFSYMSCIISGCCTCSCALTGILNWWHTQNSFHQSPHCSATTLSIFHVKSVFINRLIKQFRSYSLLPFKTFHYLMSLIWSEHFFWRRLWHPTPVLLPGKSHGRRSLEACSPWGRWALDTTEWLHFHFSLSCIGEGNGNSLQCSCLENPRDRGAWWAAIYGVAQSRTRLKWLSSI